MLQGNMLVVDHSQRMHLQNGLVVEVTALGGLSVDLSGSMAISLWNKNCQTLVKNRLAHIYAHTCTRGFRETFS